MVLIQLLLPAAAAENDGVTAGRFTTTREELVEAFGGVTAYARSPAQGLWTSPDGEPAQDEVVMVEVVTDAFERAWWTSYEKVLAERFAQDVIHIRAIPVSVLDAEAT
jgi:hypothetical protein